MTLIKKDVIEKWNTVLEAYQDEIDHTNKEIIAAYKTMEKIVV